MTVPAAAAAASAADPTAGGRHVSIVAEGTGDVTELSRGTRGARMIGVPAGTDEDGNTVGMAAAAGVGAMNLALPSATEVSLCNYIS